MSFAVSLEQNQFAAGDRTRDENGVLTIPVTQLARSAEPINHWWWGKVIHDMDGFNTDQARLPIDWRHDDKVELGYLENYNASHDGLTVSGAMVSIDPDDQADKICRRGDAGIPYQSSIYFSASRIEEVREGATAEVNGYTVEGPATIVREWSLKGMAVCLYGADHRTNTQFSDGGETVTVQLTQTEPDMSTDAPATETTVTDATPTEAANELAAKADRSELKKYMDKFGAENGAKWFADEVSFADAQDKHAEHLAEQLAAKDAKIAEVEDKLSSIDRGEDDPVDFTTDEADAPAIAPVKRQGFASKIRIQGTTKA